MGNDIHIKARSGKLPTIVMLHGLFGSLSNFEPIIPLITDEADIWIPDLPLYDLNGGDNAIHTLTKWLEEWLQEKNLQSVVLVGNSLGGHIALDYARNNPNNLKGLVLVGSSGLMPNEFGDSRPRRYDRDYISAKASEVFHALPVQQQMVDEIFNILANRSKLAQLVRLAKASKNTMMDEFLGKLQLPTLIIWGKNDRITPPEVAVRFQSLLPNSQLRWIHECGHVPMMEQPEIFAEILNEFILSDLFMSPDECLEITNDFQSAI
jgi:2-hydroxy-6-oxonona-2,4-dienedioate hydrolase